MYNVLLTPQGWKSVCVACSLEGRLIANIIIFLNYTQLYKTITYLLSCIMCMITIFSFFLSCQFLSAGPGFMSSPDNMNLTTTVYQIRAPYLVVPQPSNLLKIPGIQVVAHVLPARSSWYRSPAIAGTFRVGRAQNMISGRADQTLGSTRSH